MSKIHIKIVEVDQRTRSIVVKFASEQSFKSLDEYDGLSFNVANFTSLTPEEFIESIRPQISRLVSARDQSEKIVQSLDISSWQNYTTTVDAIEHFDIDPAVAQQIIPALNNSEVIL